ncbi:MAG: prepilin-type N-terminal cleavage/methylation domain-containing protein [Candidatus Aminicenantes bacterium]|nr:prepilin-type N-terminal cleavage/methylation domain-containing protein [Candidatus Aminicenantes bacterium]
MLRGPAVRRPTRRGFSLIEVLVAMLVLATIVLTLISVLVYGFGALARTKQVALATQICQEQVDLVRSTPFASILTLGSAFANPKLAELQAGTGSQAVENITPSGTTAMVKYAVSVTWLYHGQTMRKDVVTFITRNGINKK